MAATPSGDDSHQLAHSEISITPLFVSITPSLILTDHDGCSPAQLAV